MREFYFRYIHDLLMEREFNTRKVLVTYITHTVMLSHGTSKLSDCEFKTQQISLNLKSAKI